MRQSTLMLVALLMFVVGCGGDDNAAETATGTAAAQLTANAASEDSDGDDESSDDATSCNLLTAQDLSGAGLEATGDPVPNELATSDECRFAVADGSVVVIYYTESEATALGPDLYPGTEVLDGIGAEAWYVDGFRLAQVRLENGRVISIQDDTELDDVRDVLAELAAAAVDRA